MRVRLLLAVMAATSTGPAVAQGTSASFGKGDAALGEPLASRDCIACHARRFDGDADRMYLRPDRKVRSPAQLLAQIRYCNTELDAGYFPDEEDNLAAYLNKKYYHFQ